ncbi:MAG TPA: hypothetical protein VH813_01085 [Candidatus Limnocylindrales bacterium]
MFRAVATGILAALLVIACGSTAGSPSARPSPSPSVSLGPDESPLPTPWPGGTVDAIIVLAAADGEIAEAGADLQRAAQTEDLDLMRRAATGLADVIAGNEPNVGALAAYPPLAPVAAKYQAAFPMMLDGARALSTAIDTGDATAIASASQQLAEGLRLYGALRPDIGTLAGRAIEMKRVLVK